jgi:hypothetical protein
VYTFEFNSATTKQTTQKPNKYRLKKKKGGLSPTAKNDPPHNGAPPSIASTPEPVQIAQHFHPPFNGCRTFQKNRPRTIFFGFSGIGAPSNSQLTPSQLFVVLR